MPAVFVPIQRRFDPGADTDRFSTFTRMPGLLPVIALAPVAPGQGRATVNGVELTAWDSADIHGIHLLFLPVGEVAFEHDGRWRVTLEGFQTPDGRRFPRCAFWIRTTKRRQRRSAYDPHDEQALNAAREGMVLLRNENGALPLAKDAVLNCLGRGQHLWRTSAAGASRINPRWSPGFHQAVAEHSAFRVNDELARFFRDPRSGVPDAALLERARERSDAALVFIERHSGEMIDNRAIQGEYYLSEEELALLAAARKAFKRVIVILNTGHPIAMGWLQRIPVDAVLYTGFAGMLASYALTEILDGRTDPSGHLPDTWAWDIQDSPVSRNFPALGPGEREIQEDATGVRVYYEENIYMGYRWFDTFGVPVAFCFGHGLSYTRFELKCGGVKREAGGAAVAVRVTNVGGTAGKAVVQLYTAPPALRLERPAHVLSDFEKTRLLAPGESQDMTLSARWEDIAAFDEAIGAWVLEPGEYGFSVGESLDARMECGSLSVEAQTFRRVEHIAAPVEDLRRLTRVDPTVDGTRSRLLPLGEQIAVPAPRAAYAPAPLKRAKGRRVRWAQVGADPEKLEAFVAQMSLFELCRLNVCAGARWMPWQDGAAGYTPRLRRYGLPSFSVSDANAGLNLKKPNIGFPASHVIAATFNRDIARSVGRVIAEECPEHGIALNLGPGMNLHRSPLCGRHPEYFSEDPYLTGELAGWHGRGLMEGGVGCCYKHLFCNNAELGRLGSHSVVPEQALRELYFRAFEIAFRIQKPAAVMTAYNALNGLYPGENAAILQGLLRQEWGFDGVIMSDWSSTRTVSAVEMVKAGNCWITPGGPKWVWKIYTAARKGDISRATLENNVRFLLKGLGRISL